MTSGEREQDLRTEARERMRRGKKDSLARHHKVLGNSLLQTNTQNHEGILDNEMSNVLVVVFHVHNNIYPNSETKNNLGVGYSSMY